MYYGMLVTGVPKQNKKNQKKNKATKPQSLKRQKGQ